MYYVYVWFKDQPFAQSTHLGFSIMLSIFMMNVYA